MSSSGEAIYLGLWLILPVSALLTRRLPIGATLKMALAWTLIFVAAFLVVAGWQLAMQGGSALGSLFK